MYCGRSMRHRAPPSGMRGPFSRSIVVRAAVGSREYAGKFRGGLRVMVGILERAGPPSWRGGRFTVQISLLRAGAWL